MSLPDRAREVRAALVDVHHVAGALGLLGGPRTFTRQTGGGLMVRCPSHDERSPSCSITLGPDRTIRVRCFGCDFSGDVLTLIAVVRGLSIQRDFREVLVEGARLGGLWALVEELEQGGARSSEARRESPRTAAPSAPLPAPDYPPAGDVERLWSTSGATADDAEVSAWLRSRALDPDRVDAGNLARAIPAGDELPAWAGFRDGRRWPASSFRLVVPMFDEAGRLRSVRARRVALTPSKLKALAPMGHKTAGVIMACELGRAMLAGTYAPACVVVSEGEADWMTWATMRQARPFASLGLVASSWTEEIARRIPDGAEVIIRTDHDDAGEKYAAEIRGTLARRCRLLRSKRA